MKNNKGGILWSSWLMKEGDYGEEALRWINRLHAETKHLRASFKKGKKKQTAAITKKTTKKHPS